MGRLALVALDAGGAPKGVLEGLLNLVEGCFNVIGSILAASAAGFIGSLVAPELIVAVSAGKTVVARFAVQLIRAIAAEQGIGVIHSSGDKVRSSPELVVAGATVEVIIAFVAFNAIVPATA